MHLVFKGKEIILTDINTVCYEGILCFFYLIHHLHYKYFHITSYAKILEQNVSTM